MAQGGGEDEDYFAHFGDLEFTEEDLARIDLICEREFEPVLQPPKSKGEAQVTIEVEPALEVVLPPTSPPRSPMSEAPYHAFRSGKSLSVSDLTGPLWCVGRRSLIHTLIGPVGASYNMSIDKDKGGVSKSRTARRRSFQERGIQ